MSTVFGPSPLTSFAAQFAPRCLSVDGSVGAGDTPWKGDANERRLARRLLTEANGNRVLAAMTGFHGYRCAELRALAKLSDDEFSRATFFLQTRKRIDISYDCAGAVYSLPIR